VHDPTTWPKISLYASGAATSLSGGDPVPIETRRESLPWGHNRFARDEIGRCNENTNTTKPWKCKTRNKNNNTNNNNNNNNNNNDNNYNYNIITPSLMPIGAGLLDSNPPSLKASLLW
jgi:hypothetical protein